MKIKSLRINEFKRFSNLVVKDIPESARLVMLVGPNGSGKTSLFDAINFWQKLHAFGNIGDYTYYDKKTTDLKDNTINWQQKVDVIFHQECLNGEKLRGHFYFRSAYRNEPDFDIGTINKQGDPTQNIKLNTLMQNDQTVSENYQRLVADTVERLFCCEANNNKTVIELRDELIGKIRSSLNRVFSDLNLVSVGKPLSNGSFFFEKGVAKDFHYKNLSAGEKSAFDLILDIVMKSHYYEDAVYCIDEPEAHMHTQLQGKVLKELYNLIPQQSQLWISTHSIGMLDEAQQIESTNPGTVIFLDFGARDFDSEEIMTPAKISNALIERFYDMAFGNFARLMLPKRIVFCEGTEKGRDYKDFDKLIYSKIFANKYSDTTFISMGSCNNLEKMDELFGDAIKTLLKGSSVIKVMDRDDRSDNEIKERATKGIRVLKKRHIESYLLDNTVIELLCKSFGKEEFLQECLNAKERAMQDSISRGNPDDDVKSASGDIYTKLKGILSITQGGNNCCSFLRDTIAPLITEETSIYKQLEEEIFGHKSENPYDAK